ncbi:hypothetical protein L873DRAFT_1021321 [Choiromyces venosus 120613-1]|uniref:Uncharacterized protein n=1 Tax=Choiromyces venosus 120613-1 TaxID=1336337 RepID=A0A3N4JK80_9PEZI|nr:hypothetical protein L873DRAFT_1021321 [Choiromyces venosus 120613-1]
MNSSVRSNLEHSDRQVPSKDLDYNLANAQGLRFVALGGIWVDPKTNLLSQASTRLQEFFKNKDIKRVLGLQKPNNCLESNQIFDSLKIQDSRQIPMAQISSWL